MYSSRLERLSQDLLSRYPLIFGSWHKVGDISNWILATLKVYYQQKLDAEQPFFLSVARSIINIMERSEDDRFSKKCHRLLKVSEVGLLFAKLIAVAVNHEE